MIKKIIKIIISFLLLSLTMVDFVLGSCRKEGNNRSRRSPSEWTIEDSCKPKENKENRIPEELDPNIDPNFKKIPLPKILDKTKESVEKLTKEGVSVPKAPKGIDCKVKYKNWKLKVECKW